MRIETSTRLRRRLTWPKRFLSNKTCHLKSEIPVLYVPLPTGFNTVDNVRHSKSPSFFEPSETDDTVAYIHPHTHTYTSCVLFSDVIFMFSQYIKTKIYYCDYYCYYYYVLYKRIQGNQFFRVFFSPPNKAIITSTAIVALVLFDNNRTKELFFVRFTF